ncbi:MAG: 16S rRNA (cytosine(1402)-N(4))-methyltransferase RsmH [Mangrovibacterium sp.]
MNTEYHIPVLRQESIDGLNIDPNGKYVDVTFGGGGHSSLILEALTGGKLYAFDQDVDAVKNVFCDDRFVFFRHNFKYMRNFLKYEGVEKVDGILADLGVSSHDFDVAERGFSFRFDGDLDMRMNRNAQKTAADIVNEMCDEDLAKMFRQYGEVENAWKLAQQICKARKEKAIKTIADFKLAIEPCVIKKAESKYLAKVFQALRIETNGELDVLKEFLEQSVELLNPGGRLVVITYHSLEDRLVKNFIKAGNFEGKQEVDFYGNIQNDLIAVNRKVVVPDEAEIERNPRARSAKLRIAEKK